MHLDISTLLRCVQRAQASMLLRSLKVGGGQAWNPHYTDGIGKKRGWSAGDTVGYPASAGGRARPQAPFHDPIFSGMNVPSTVGLRTDPVKTHLPVQFGCFNIAEAVGLRAGQQQDVSLLRTKHTDHTKIPKTKLSQSRWEVNTRGMQGLFTYGNKIIFFQANDISNLNLFPLGNFESKC